MQPPAAHLARPAREKSLWKNGGNYAIMEADAARRAAKP